MNWHHRLSSHLSEPRSLAPENGVDATGRLRTTDSESRSAALRLWIFQILLLLCLWVALHPYKGIIHDARLYLVNALNGIDHRFAQDLFLVYGSQEKFTVFSFLYRPIIRSIGFVAAHGVVLVIGQLAWFASMLYFVRASFESRENAVLAAAAIIILYPYYDGVHIFSYGENFATPRIYAEALIMLALAVAQRHRLVLAIAPLAAAAALHPLMSVPGIAVVSLLAVRRHRRLWLLYLMALAGGLFLASFGIEPFTRVFMWFDPVWFDASYRYGAFAFVTRWPWLGFVGPLSSAAVLVMAWTVAEPVQRQFIAAVSTVAAAGVGLTLLGGEVGRNVLALDLQPWRALWLLTVLGNAWAAVLAFRLPAAWLSRKLILVGLAAQAVAMAAEATMPLPSALFIVACLSLLCEQHRHEALGGAFRAAAWLIAAAVIAITFSTLVFFLKTRVSLFYAEKQIVAFGIVIAASIMIVLSMRNQFPSRLSNLILILLVVGAFAVVDRRDEWRKFLEDGDVREEMERFVGDSKNIYWERGLDLLWFKLDRPSYYSCPQGAATIMYRDTALEFKRRSEGLAGLNTEDFGEIDFISCAPKQDRQAQGPQARDQIAAACRALPELDAMVLLKPVAGTKHTRWRAPAGQIVTKAGRQPESFDTFYMYRCSDFR
jgi:hypothetical protein